MFLDPPFSVLEDRNVMQRHRICKSFTNVCDVKSAEKRYACFKIVNNKTKMNKTCVSSHGCLGSPVDRKKRVPANGIYFPRGNKSF